MAAVLRKMGIENCAFHLALTQPDLAKYDPNNLTDDSDELKKRIAHEAQVNPWYFFREVLLVPSQGGPSVRFMANRGNLAAIWSYLSGVDPIQIQPRQTGKTYTAIGISCLMIYIIGYHIDISMYTKDSRLLQDNVSRLKGMRDSLPPWMISLSSADVDNKEGLFYAKRKTGYKTLVAQSDKRAASGVGRGQSPAILHFDEPPFCANIRISYPVLMTAATTAAENARAQGIPVANLFTTTAARTDDDSGSFGFALVSNAMPFTERLYDCQNNAAVKEMVANNSVNGRLNCTFSYQQLGKGDEWFRDVCQRLDNVQDDIDREVLNLWRAGVDTAILPNDVIDVLKEHAYEPTHVDIVDEHYVFNWYVSMDEYRAPGFKNRKFILGMDSSTNVGRDFTSLVLIDPATMKVVATFRTNDVNIIMIAIMIGNFLVEFRNTVFIPERASTGSTIIDQVILILVRAGMNPLRRIFNYIVQDRDVDESLRRIRLDDECAGKDVRKHLGFKTTGDTRKVLYKSVLQKAARRNAKRIYDRTIIRELSSLSVVNGRIDHTHGNHDDSAIAYLIACWMVYEGKNLVLYGLDTATILSEADEELTENLSPQQVQYQKQMREQYALAKRLYDSAIYDSQKKHYSAIMKRLEHHVSDSMTVEPMSVDQVTASAKSEKSPYLSEESNAQRSKSASQQRSTFEALQKFYTGGEAAL
jgi:hypothetical protein